MEIITAGDLRKRIIDLVSSFQSDRSTGEYLRAMLTSIYDYKETKPTFEIFSNLLESALNAVPAEFLIDWYMYKIPPFLNCEPNPDDFENSLIEPITSSVVTKFEVLEKNLMFEIAEYKRVFENSFISTEISDEASEDNCDILFQLGWTSPNLYDFLNFVAESITFEDETECDWLTFVDILEYARTRPVYEE